jgi:hypothetical protein
MARTGEEKIRNRRQSSNRGGDDRCCELMDARATTTRSKDNNDG